MSRIVAAVSNVSMSLGHDGLVSICKQLKINPDTMKDGDLVLFVNRARNRLKLLGPQGIVLGYLKMPNEQRLPLEAVQYIPRTFTANGRVNLGAAVEAYLVDRLKKRAKPREEMDLVRNR